MKRHLFLIAILLIAASIYWPGLSGPLIFDDAQNLAPIGEWLRGERAWLSVVLTNDSGSFGRPVSMASFVLNVAVTGSDIWGLKLGNLVLHLLNGSVVYLLFGALLRQRAMTRDPEVDNRWVPLLGTAIWLTHPLFASTVLYVVQRMAMLSALFMLLTMLTYLHGRVALNAGQHRKAWTLLALVPLLTIMAALSKENGILAPALCAVIELCVFAPEPTRRRPWASRLVIGVGLWMPALVAIFLTATRHPAIIDGYANRPFTLMERLLTQPRILWDYIGSLVIPHGPELGIYHDDYPISRGILDPASTVLALLAWFLILGIAWRWRRRIPGFLLGLGIFLVGHALESSAFALIMYFEHRNYLPAVGAMWALLSLAAAVASHMHRHTDITARIPHIAAIGVVLAFSTATAGRAMVWRSEASLLAQGLQHHPNSRWLRVALIKQAMEVEPIRRDDAREHAEHLMDSADTSTRRLGAVLGLMIACAAEEPAPPLLVAAAFSGRPEPMEADLLVAFEALSEGVIDKPCPNLTPSVLAEQMSSLLDRSQLSPGHSTVWRLRLKTAKAYLNSGNADAALQQAMLAYADDTVAAPVPMFIAALLLQKGDARGAAAMLNAAERKMAKHDRPGRAMLMQYRAEAQRQIE